MPVNDDIFSIRIVVADFYSCKPVVGLDPCYSEFRGSEIKSVPVIRIFGANRDGEKTCMHVHGVFPYFYVPYESSDLGSADRLKYQIASSVDKAVNISLGQANSHNQHIYKIQLVKGIPFYGYHRRESKFLKIYLYNPRFVRRVANLFQNGAILGKVFQPHESHVSYILQFLIDYNLYGMSFLHIPREILKYRECESHGSPSYITKMQTINVPRVSTSYHELDAAAIFILNRFETLHRSSEHTNPGIASIWQDERIRRNNLADQLEMPQLEIPASQERVNIQPTESEKFYKIALKSKLENTKQSLDQTVANLSVTEKKQTFNLKKILQNSIYPEECSQEEVLTNASLIQDHFSNQSLFHASIKNSGSLSTHSDISLNDTVIDEELVLSLTQSQPLQEQDYALLEVMKELEEGNEDRNLLDVMQKLEEGDIDLDSTLAPLTQAPKYPTSQDATNGSVSICTDNVDGDSDEEKAMDFTALVDDIDEVLAKLSQSFSIPQLDGGGDDDIWTPKSLTKRKTLQTMTPVKQKSPRKQAKMSRYTPLKILTTKSPKKIDEQNVICKSSSVENLDVEIIEENNNTQSDLSIVYNNLQAKVKINGEVPKITRKRKAALNGEVNGSIISCNLRMRNRKQSTDSLKVYDTRSRTPTPTNITTKVNKRALTPRISVENRIKSTSIINKILKEKSLRKCAVKIKRLKTSEIRKTAEKNAKNNKNVYSNNRRKSWSPCDIAREYDRRNNFFPEPGPSHVNYYELIEVPNPKTPNRIKPREEETPINEEQTETTLNGYGNGKAAEVEEDLNICSFYEKSFIVNSPSMFSDSSPSENVACSMEINKNKKINNCSSENLIITSKELPPDPQEVIQNLYKYDIPEVTHIQPFYSNASDITQRKEIGNTVLRLPGNSLNDCEEFTSIIKDLNGIYTKRRKILLSMCGEELIDQFKSNTEIKEYFSSYNNIVISTRDLPPTKRDAKIWLKARELMQDKQEKIEEIIDVDEYSPVNVRREQPKMILNHNPDGSDVDLDSSLKMTPITPVDRRRISKECNNTIVDVDSCNINNLVTFTPPSSKSSSSNIAINNKQISKVALSLSKQSNISTKFNTISEHDNEQQHKIKCIPADRILRIKSNSTDKSSQESAETEKTDDSVNTDIVLANLERSSFVKDLNLEGNPNVTDISFGISGATLNNTFKISLENLQNAKADIEYDYLTTMCIEVFVATRNDLKPNPEYDSIQCLFYSIINNVPSTSQQSNKTQGFIIVVDGDKFNLSEVKVPAIKVTSEIELLNKLLELCKIWDPDIFAGYEIEMSSWGYVMDRAREIGINLTPLLSRVPTQKIRNATDEEQEQFSDLDIELKLCGRILLDVWRLLRHEIALTSYTFENVTYHILHRRCPMHSYSDLTKWYKSPLTRWIVLEYYLDRVNGTLELLEQLDLIGRTSEMAKIIGIQFYEVLSRGSQFRVESMMLRISKPKNLVPLSPSVQQRAHMQAPEYLPLILEPQSRLYVEPLIVLDFQSLYPSMIIAYNYCFSTCLGRVQHLGDSSPFEFGASQLRVSPALLKKLIECDEVTISPCGAVFVKSTIREGILPRMLREILDTRLMVKQSMKIHKGNSVLQRVLHSRQLALKLMANVTYGYTAANFSGRMPCVEVGDSVVSKGRETLERAIKLVEQNEKWRVKVVYGDTDSLFVLVPGRSREEAFKIGAEIAEAVTNDNPQPVKLKLEKVYEPSILQTKKRYVGYMYESADQAEPVYEAKGIETVRRDGCPAVAKMLEKCLRILFETRDVSQVKKYVCRQFTKLLSGHANVKDLIFAKEFRGKNGYKPGACVPALELTRKWLQTDPRNEPRRGERVPFLIVNGPPGVPLIRLVRSPHEYLADDGLKINAIYYITKAIIPPINRCFLLIGADINEWFAELPRKNFIMPKLSNASKLITGINANKKSTISQYFSSTNCVIDCGKQTKTGICSECLKDSRKCVTILSKKVSKLEREYFLTKKVCQKCCFRECYIECHSLDCPILFIMELKKREQKQVQHFRNLIQDNF